MNQLQQLTQYPNLSSTEKHGIMIEIISLNPIYSEPCRLTHHLYSTRITYLNTNLMSNENSYMFPQVIYVISTVSYQYPMAKLNPNTSKNSSLRTIILINPIYSGVMKVMLIYTHDPTKFTY